MPLPQLIGQVILHTPLWVWGLFAFVTFMGLRQLADQVVTSRRVLGMSLGWTVFSLSGAVGTFGFSAAVLLAWFAGLALSLALQHWLIAPRGVKAVGGRRFAVAGSIWPLLTIWAIFSVRYVTSVMMVLNPALKQSTAFDLAVAAAYGMLSSLFLGRALRVLRSAPATPALALA